MREKAAYKGPWEVPKRRAKKHPLAPKRPMSAFLKYSQTRRSVVKTENPDMSNTDVSRLLGEMWRNASPKERAPYVEQEERERAVYKKAIASWRSEQAKLDAASRTSHRSVQQLVDHSPQAYQYAVDDNSHQRVQRLSDHMPHAYEGHRSQIAGASSHDDSISPPREYGLPHVDHYGAQYSSRGHPAVGSGM